MSINNIHQIYRNYVSVITVYDRGTKRVNLMIAVGLIAHNTVSFPIIAKYEYFIAFLWNTLVSHMNSKNIRTRELIIALWCIQMTHNIKFYSENQENKIHILFHQYLSVFHLYV